MAKKFIYKAFVDVQVIKDDKLVSTDSRELHVFYDVNDVKEYLRVFRESPNAKGKVIFASSQEEIEDDVEYYAMVTREIENSDGKTYIVSLRVRCYDIPRVFNPLTDITNKIYIDMRS